ncbi:TPA: carbon storage regulator, partial [Legionella pneumophila]|nr:carbon storage regulator [Legionella pneumophila]
MKKHEFLFITKIFSNGGSVLVLSRRLGETIVIDRNIKVT